MTKTRIVALVNGPWQAVTLAASLRQLKLRDSPLVVLVDMVDGSRLCDTTLRILQANGLVDTLCIPAGSARSEAQRRLRDVIQLADVERVATYGVHRPLARFLCNLMPHAKLLVYEDGLRAYVEADASWRGRLSYWLRRSAPLLGKSFGMAWRDPRSARTNVEYALLLTDLIGAPREASGNNRHDVSREQLRDVIERTAPRFQARLERPFFLIVGQYYASLKQMSQRNEIQRYLAAAREIERLGFVPVWRGHIRKDDQYYEQLKRACPALQNFSALVEDASYPLELYRSMFDARCAGAVSFSSSALFYLRQLYNVPTYTLLDETLVRGMSYPHRDGCALALTHLPKLLPSMVT